MNGFSKSLNQNFSCNLLGLHLKYILLIDTASTVLSLGLVRTLMMHLNTRRAHFCFPSPLCVYGVFRGGREQGEGVSVHLDNWVGMTADPLFEMGVCPKPTVLKAYLES